MILSWWDNNLKISQVHSAVLSSVGEGSRNFALWGFPTVSQ